jgi:Trp operon repressor
LASPLEQKLDRLLVTLDEIKPTIDRFRLIEALKKQELN